MTPLFEPLRPQQLSKGDAGERITLISGHVRLSPPVGGTKGGRRYRCTLIESGKNKNGWILPVDVLSSAMTKFAGAPCQIDHPGWFDPPSLERLAGTFEDPVMVGMGEKSRLDATLRLADTPSGELLQRIFDAWIEDKEAGLQVADIGLSAVLWLRWGFTEDGDPVCKEIKLVESVDAVLHPAAGGMVQHVLNSVVPVNGHQHNFTGAIPLSERSTNMPEEVTQSENGAPPSLGGDGGNEHQTAPPPPNDGRRSLTEPPMDLSRALETITRVAERVENLTGQVDRLTSVVAEQAADRTITGLGEAPRDSVRMGRNSMEQIEEALDAILEGRRPRDGVAPLTGVRELYLLLSGDYEMTGRFYPDRVMLANVNSSTMAALVANRLNKVVVNTFQNYPKWWEPIVVEMDFATLQDARWITLGGIGELPTVSEGAAYTELTWDDNTETAAFVKKGGYLGLTLEAMDKDDTRRLRMAPAALAQAGWLTLSKSVSDIFTYNSGVGHTLADSTALFADTRDNLGSTALSHAAWVATRLAMRKFTEINSSERLGALCAPKFLLVPPDLETTALQVMATEHVPGFTDYNINPYAEGDGRMARLQSARERVIVVDLWTDTDNWAAVADPMLYPSIAIGYRYGRTPELFSVASPTAGLMFSNDVMPVKVRFFYATGATDWRGLYKHNV